MKEEIVFKNVNDLSKIENYLGQKVREANQIVQTVNQSNDVLLETVFQKKISDDGELSDDEYLLYALAHEIVLMQKYLEDYTKLFLS